MSLPRKSVLPENVGTTRERMEWFNATPNFYRDPAVLREVRYKLGVSQSELAKKTGLKKSLIADVETNRRKFSEEIRELIWQGLFDLGPSGHLSEEDPRSVVRHTVMEALRQSRNARPPSTLSSMVIKEQEEELAALRAENAALHDLVDALKTQNTMLHSQLETYVKVGTVQRGEEALLEWSKEVIGFQGIQQFIADRYSKAEKHLEKLSTLPRDLLDHPVIAELIESFRREIAELQQQAKRPVESETESD